MQNGITKLSVGGFKSIADEVTLDIKPLTLLAGANSSGKSSFMQPLLLLKQTLESPYDQGPLVLNGANVKFTDFNQLLTSLKRHTPQQEFSVSLYFGKNRTTLFFAKKDKQITVSCLPSFSTRTRIDSDMGEAQLLDAIKKLKTEVPSWAPHGTSIADWKVARKYCILYVGGQVSHKGQSNHHTLLYCLFNDGIFSQVVESAIHVPGLRGNPERSYPATSITSAFSGTFENHTASVLAHWCETKSDKLETLRKSLLELGLTSAIDAKRLNDAQIEVKVGRLPKNGTSKADMVSIADVGFGVSQTLPVLVALLVAEPGQLVYLEQPEIHLHPRAQRALAGILVDAANRGVRVVTETHSSMLLLAVQTLVAKGKITPDNVALHWFERNKSGKTDVSTASLDKAGAFGEWPVDFGDVELDAEGDYLEAVALTRRKR